MISTEQRGFGRSALQWPILFADDPREGFHDAYMYNTGDGGLYFESLNALPQSSSLYIRMKDFNKISRTDQNGGAYRAWMGKVRWCKRIPETFSLRYGVGIEYVLGGKIVVNPAAQQWYFCDMCEKKAIKEIHAIDKGVNLCLDCFRKLGEMGNGVLGQSIIRFSMGNVC